MKSFAIASYLGASVGVAACVALPARAESPGDIPNPQAARKSFVADNANVLNAQTVRKLDDLINGVKKRTGAEIAVVTVRDLGGISVEDFSNQLFNLWGIGGKSKENGVLLLLSIGDRRQRTEIGDGAGALITDSASAQITRSFITPRLKAGDYNGALYNGTFAIAQKLDPSLAGTNSAPSANNSVPSSPGNSPDSPFSVPNSSSPYSPQTPFENPRSSADSPAGSSGGGGSSAPLILLLVLGGGGAMTWVWLSSRPPKCPKCKAAMNLVPENEEDAFLSDIQQLEESLGGREWNVWRCPRDGYQEIMKHDKWLSSVSNCPRCGNRTATSTTQTLRYATQFQTGLEQTMYVCHNPACRHQWTTQRTIPRDVPVVIASGGGSGRSSGGSSENSGGGSFGGGYSSGGGSSSSW